MITVVTKYEGSSAEFYVGIIKGHLTDEQRAELRDRFDCDNGDDFDDDKNNMFFREYDTDGDFPVYDELMESFTLYNVDGENKEPVNPRN